MKAVGIFAGVVLVASLIYGSYWIAKTVSYSVFYEGMVRETVREMVKEGALR